MVKFPGLEIDRKELKRIWAVGEKFLVVSRSEGLGDVLFALGHAWLYCKKTGRTLVVDLANSRYLDDKEANAAAVLLEIPEACEGVPILVPSRIGWNLRRMLRSRMVVQMMFLRTSAFLAYYNKFNELLGRICPSFIADANQGVLNLQEEKELIRTGAQRSARFLTFRGCHWEHHTSIMPFLKALGPSKAVASIVDGSIAQMGSPFIGLHVRYFSPRLPNSRHTVYWTDFEKSIAEIRERISRARSLCGKDCPVFLSTDSREVESRLKSEQNNIVVLRKHFGDPDRAELHYQELESLGLDATAEMFILCRSKVLIRYPPSRSWFSELAARTCPHVIED